MTPSEFINEWMGKVKTGIEFRKKYSTEKNWDDHRKMYRGQWSDEVKPVNKIFSYGRMLVPRVYFKAPRVTVTALRPELVVHAKVVETIDNMILRETMLKETLKMSVLDSFLCGVGPIKLGYDSEFGYSPEQDIGGGTVTQVSQKSGERIEYRETIKPEMPWAMRCRPEDIVVPWGAQDAQSLPWIAHRILRPLEDVQQDQKYKNTKDLKGTRSVSLENYSSPFRPSEERDKEVVYAELWEIRDFRSGEVLVICEDQLLLAQKDALQVEGLPYEFVSFNPDPEYFWSIPDAHILSPQQQELNEISTQSSRHRAIALLKFLYSKGAISETELEKFLSGEIGPAVGVDADNVAGAIMPFQPHIPPDLYGASMSSINAMKESLGFSSNELGDYNSGSPRSATETMTVSQSFEQRVSERRDIMSDVLVRIIRKWNQYIFSFWTSERVSRIVGPMGEASWITYTGDQLKGEYFIHIDSDSGMPVSKSLKFQMGKDLLGSFNGDPLVDQVALRRLVLDNYSEVHPGANELLKVPPGINPMAAGMERQPFPIGAGKGSSGGRAGSSPDRAQEFDSFKKRFNQRS